MKIVIDIPEHDKNVIDRFVRGEGCDDLPSNILEHLIRGVYLGTPLKDICSKCWLNTKEGDSDADGD